MQKTKNQVMSNKKSWLYTLPLGAILLLLPFIVGFHLFETGLEEVRWTNSDGYSTDLYLYWKSVFFLAVSTFMLLLLFWDRRNVQQRIKSTKSIWLLLCGYLVFVLLSALTSDYPAYVWGGSIGQFESTFVLIGYIVTGFYAYIVCQEPEILQRIPYFLMLSAGIQGIIGAFQYAGHDLFALPAVQHLFIPDDILKQSGGIVFTMEENRVYLTLYNPNYAGVYCACMIAVFFSLLLSERRLWKKAIYVVLLVLMTVSLIGAQSKTGMIIIFLALLFLMFLHRRTLVRHWYIVFPGTALAVFFIVLVLRSGSADLLQLIADGILPVRSDYRLEEVITDEEGIHFTYDSISFVVGMQVSKNFLEVTAARSDGRPIDIVESRDTSAHVYLVSDGLPKIPVQFMNYQGILCMDVVLDEADWIVTNQLASTYLYLNRYGKFDTISMPGTAIFTDYPSWLTYRGFIWARSIPLLKEHLFLGSGADTFLMEYPNDDYLGLHQSKTYGEYTTRPHNWYLQVGIQTGMISLLFLLAALLIYGKRGFLFCLRIAGAENDKTQRLCEAFIAGAAVILLMNFINDSSLCTTPLLWCLTGASLACMESVSETKND